MTDERAPPADPDAPPDGYLTEAGALERLRERCRGFGNLRRIARKAGVASCYVSLMRTGQRPINGAVAAAIGLQPVQLFRQIPATPSDALPRGRDRRDAQGDALRTSDNPCHKD